MKLGLMGPPRAAHTHRDTAFYSYGSIGDQVGNLDPRASTSTTGAAGT